MSDNSNFQFSDLFGGPSQRFFTTTGVEISPLVMGKLSGMVPRNDFYTPSNGKKLFDVAVGDSDPSTQAAALHFLNELLMPILSSLVRPIRTVDSPDDASELGQNIITEIGAENFSKGLFDLVATHEDKAVTLSATTTIKTGIQVSPQEIATTETAHRLVDLACDPNASLDRKEAAFEILRQAVASNKDGVDAYVVERLSAALEDLTKSGISDLTRNDRRILRDLCETLGEVATHKPEMVDLIGNNLPQNLADVPSRAGGVVSSNSVRHLAGVLDRANRSNRLASLAR